MKINMTWDIRFQLNYVNIIVIHFKQLKKLYEMFYWAKILTNYTAERCSSLVDGNITIPITKWPTSWLISISDTSDTHEYWRSSIVLHFTLITCNINNMRDFYCRCIDSTSISVYHISYSNRKFFLGYHVRLSGF